MKIVKNILSALTNFSRDERLAITILAIATLTIISIRIATKSSLGKMITINTTEVSTKVSALTKDTLFRFDPNTISIEDLQRLGFSVKQARAIDNYRQAGRG